MRGTSSEVGGINFEMSSKNTVRASKTEIQRDIFSPDSEGRTNTKIARLEHFKEIRKNAIRFFLPDNKHARNYQIHSIKKRFSSHNNIKTNAVDVICRNLLLT